MLKTVLNTVTVFRLQLQTSLYKFAELNLRPSLLEEPIFFSQTEFIQERLDFKFSVHLSELAGAALKKWPLRHQLNQNAPQTPDINFEIEVLSQTDLWCPIENRLNVMVSSFCLVYERCRRPQINQNIKTFLFVEDYILWFEILMNYTL